VVSGEGGEGPEDSITRGSGGGQGERD
jgi:hypothetical protein